MSRRGERGEAALEGCERPGEIAACESGELVLEGERLRARLIREGVSKNGRSWTRKIIDKLATLVEGVPVNLYDFSQRGDGSYLTHYEYLRAKLPPAIRELLPERLPAAEIGVVRNPEVVVESDGKASLWGDVEPGEGCGWVRQCFDRLRLRGKPLGLSIHVPPDGLESRRTPAGLSEPTDVTRVVGFDVVTYPSAGGSFAPVLESLLQEETRMKKGLVKRLLRFVPESKRAALKAPDGVDDAVELVKNHRPFVEAVCEALEVKFDESSAAAVLEAIAGVPDEEPGKKEEPAPKQAAPAATPKAEAAKTPEAAAATSKPPEGPALEGSGPAPASPRVVVVNDPRTAVVNDAIKRLNKERGEAAIEAELRTAALPQALAEFAKTELAARLSEKGALEAEEVKTYVASLKKSVGRDQRPSAVEAAIPERFAEMGITSGEKSVAALEALLERKPNVKVGNDNVVAFRSIREAYGVLTGDTYCEGSAFYERRNRPHGALESIDVDASPNVRRFRPYGGALEAAGQITTALFPLILSDAMHKIMVKDYQRHPLYWKLIARPDTFTDFKAWRYQRLGEFGDLAVVGEMGPYVDFDAADFPAEEEVSITAQKHGNKARLSWEAIVNDNTSKFQQFPDKIARAAARTLDKLVFGLLLNNSVVYDTQPLACAAHNNLISTGYSPANLKAARNLMVRQRDLNSREQGRVRPDRLLCGTGLYDQAYESLYSPNKPSLATANTNAAAGTPNAGSLDNPNLPNVLRGDYGITPYEIPYFDDVAGAANDWWLLADPSVVDFIIVGFLNGKQDPELFVQDLEKVGSFFDNDALTYKVRHVYGAKAVDYRPAVGGIVP